MKRQLWLASLILALIASPALAKMEYPTPQRNYYASPRPFPVYVSYNPWASVGKPRYVTDHIKREVPSSYYGGHRSFKHSKGLRGIGKKHWRKKKFGYKRRGGKTRVVISTR